MIEGDIDLKCGALGPGDVLLLENVRFEPGETENDPKLAESLAQLADLYVNDAFGAAHRAHASTEGVAHHLPGYAGLLLEREVTELTAVVESPERPLVVVLGGSKVSDKIGVIDRFLEVADQILIGGAMCFSFFRAQGIGTGDSLVEEKGVELAAEALERAKDSDCELILPVDLVLGESFDAETERRESDGVEVPGRLDGPRHRPAHAPSATPRRSPGAGTVLWNGPMGAFEMEPFAAGTRDRRRGGRRRPRHHRDRRRRLGRGAAQVRPRRQGRLALDRRRSILGAAGGKEAARGRGPARQGEPDQGAHQCLSARHTSPPTGR